MNRKIFGIAVFIFALIFGQSVFADSWGCGEGIKNLISSLKLDADQQAKIKVIKEQLKTNLKPSWEKMEPLHAQINEQIRSDNMDQSALDSLIDTKAQLIGDMIKAKAAAKHQIYALLTPQQKAQYQQIQQQVEAKIASKFEKCHEDENDN